MKRTDFCGELRLKDLEREVVLMVGYKRAGISAHLFFLI